MIEPYQNTSKLEHHPMFKLGLINVFLFWSFFEYDF